MTKLEFCTAVLRALGGQWPYTGALGEAAKAYDKNHTVDDTVKAMRAAAARKRKKDMG